MTSRNVSLPAQIANQDKEKVNTGSRDLTGKVFGRLTVLKKEGSGKYGTLWLCSCACGKQACVYTGKLNYGHTRSCGCLSSDTTAERNRKESTTHGMTKTPTYRSWKAMWARTTNPEHYAYRRYKDRNICVEDPRWEKFENFLADMGIRPEGKSLDRIDTTRGYCKDNCRWATRKEQQNNTITNIRITYNSKTQTIAQWAEELNMSYVMLRQRIKYGWDIERALTAPSARKQK